MYRFNQRARFLVLGILLLCKTTLSFSGTRTDHWSGIDVALGQPFPAYSGLLIGFNLGDDARISGGIGAAGHWITSQADFKFFLLDTPFTPYIGTGVSYMAGAPGKFALWYLDFDSAIVPYIQTGLDFTTDVHEESRALHVCINLAVGIPDSKVVVLPGLAIGVYF